MKILLFGIKKFNSIQVYNFIGIRPVTGRVRCPLSNSNDRLKCRIVSLAYILHFYLKTLTLDTHKSLNLLFLMFR